MVGVEAQMSCARFIRTILCAAALLSENIIPIIGIISSIIRRAFIAHCCISVYMPPLGAYVLVANIQLFLICAKSLEARLTEKVEHVFLIGFYARLVKGIDAEGITTYTAGKFKEVYELTYCVLIYLWYGDFHYRDTT